MKTRFTILSLLTFMMYANAQTDAGTAYGISMFSNTPLHQVTARVVDKKTGAAGIGVRGYLSVPGKNFQFKTAISDSTGTLRFLLTAIDVSKPMVFQTDAIANTTYRIEPEQPFSSASTSSTVIKDSSAFYGRADKTYLLDDYTRFPTMEEVLIEYVPEVKLMKSRSAIHFQVLNDPYKTFFEDDPLVLMDGVPVFDHKQLMALDPLKIRKLEVVARKYYYGSLICNGIVSFSSYDGDLAGYAPGENATVSVYNK